MLTATDTEKTKDPQAPKHHRRSTHNRLQSVPHRSISLPAQPPHLPPWRISVSILEYEQ